MVGTPSPRGPGENMLKYFGAILFSAIFCLAAQAQADGGKQPEQTVIRPGSAPSGKANPDNFTGNVRVDPAFRAVEPARAYGAYVTFEPGARTNWHIHPTGQILIVTSGKGVTQEWGKQSQIILPGDIVVCPPGVRHWHGASPETAMTHLAIGERDPGNPVKWLERVDDEQYKKAAGEGAKAR